MTNKYVIMLEYRGHVHEVAHGYIYVYTITPKYDFYDKTFCDCCPNYSCNYMQHNYVPFMQL